MEEQKGKEWKVTKGSLVFMENQLVQDITVIVEGKLVSVNKSGRMEYKKGAVLGVVEGLLGKRTCSYFADEDTVMMVYPYGSVEENVAIAAKAKVNPGNTVETAIKQTEYLLNTVKSEEERTRKLFNYVRTEYVRYVELCKGYNAQCRASAKIVALKEFAQQTQIDDTNSEYFQELLAIPAQIRNDFLGASEYMVEKNLDDILDMAGDVADLYDEIGQYLQSSIPALIADDSDNLFSMYEDLILQIASRKGNVSSLVKKIDEILNFANGFEGIDKALISKVKESYDEKCKLVGLNTQDAGAGTETAKEGQNTVTQSVGEYTSAQLDIVKKITQNTTEKLLAYAGMEEEKSEKLRQQLTIYAGMPDKRDTSDEVSRVRRSLTALFYDLYEAVMKKYVLEEKPIPLVELFLNFGFVDEHLVSDTGLADMFYTKRDEDMGDYQIYTMKEWLFKIYKGEHEPSRNEFDLDYDATFRDMKKTQKFTKEQEEAYKHDQVGKMVFELRNMLTSVNKMTQGQIMTFCPVLCTEGDESIKNMLVQKSQVKKVFDDMLKIDYSCFYREITFWDSDHGVTKEFIQKQVKPIILLMPNIGSKGAMWQEVSGPRKDTPARFALPLMTKESIEKMAVGILGQYRWEICRNIQGAYWNDISEKSLTSEYFDYAQFYKKNHDLSQQAKDKIKQNLSRAKNSFRNMFVMDYVDWIMFEAKGSQRLNKVVREILCEYIPFPKETRETLKQNPSYAPFVEKFERHLMEKQKRAGNVESTIIKHKGKVTEDLQNYLDFLQM